MAEPTELTPPTSAPESTAPWLAVRDLHLARNGKGLLCGVSMALERKGITALIGPNGAGKSLLLRVIAGLIPADHGEIALAPELGRPALVFQKPVLLRRSAYGNLLHALKLAECPRAEQDSRIKKLLEDCGLTPLAPAPARRLSGGEQQRLAIARALASAPRLLLLDEPTASLDPKSAAAVEAIILRIAQTGVRVVFVTHDRLQVERLAEDVVFLHKGAVTEHSPKTQLLADAHSQEARAYLKGRLLL